MSSFRYEDRESPANGLVTLAIGALAGLAIGVVVAQRFGGFSGISARLRERLGHGPEGEEDAYGIEEYAQDELDEVEDDDVDSVLEERVLEAFRNDPVLCERAVDIGSVGEGIIELAGWVHDEDEAQHAVTIARGTPGVETVVNRISVGEMESALDANARRYENGDPSLTESHWEGQQVGTGRRRQGTSDEFDRHADPKPKLEDRWLRPDEAVRTAAEEPDRVVGERTRSRRSSRGGRADGSPVAPTGVPKADHVADPESAQDSMRAE